MVGAKTLSFVNYKPQKESWCEFASSLIALSVFMKEQLNVDRVFNPSVLWADESSAESINKSFKYWFDKNKARMGLDLTFYNEFYRGVHYGWIQRGIDLGYPMIVACNKWKYDNDEIVEDSLSKRVGHYFVIVGYDGNDFILDNPWGTEYSRKYINKKTLKKIGGNVLMFKTKEDLIKQV